MCIRDSGVSQGSAWTGQDFSEYMPAVYGNTNQTPAATLNTGQRPFAHTPPAGYKTLCTTNLPDPTIADGSTVMDTVTYTGNGGTQSISSLFFQPDLVWIKRRNGANAHALFDSIRGVTKVLESSNTGAEKTNDPAITSFDTNGFTVGGTYGQTNASGGTYVAWCWKAGGTAVSNTDGSITSQVSASTDYGFSVVSWTGDGSSSASLGHGLGSTPKWVICKRRNNANVWVIAHTGMGTNNMQFTNETPYSPSSASGGGGISLGNSTTITTVEGTSSSVNSNASGGTYIAYCWSEVPGFSKFGSFTGSGVSGNTVTVSYTHLTLPTKA